jgi:uncharacterized protein (DUF1330 family)
MPKGYWVTTYRSISDPKKLQAYAQLAPPAVQPFGGRYLARGTAAAAYEAGLKERIVISEFPSVEQANAAYNSPAYKKALEALGDGAVRDIRIVEGLE